MKHGAAHGVMTILAGLLLAGGLASAAQRGERLRKPPRYEVDDAVGDPAIWTKRLVGRFRMDGSIHHESEIIDHGDRDSDPRGAFEVWDVSLQGKSDCIDFTEAAGLQCVLNVSWQETWRSSFKDQMGGVPDLTPGMLLAGLAPSTARGTMRILEVDTRGLAHPGALELHGSTAIARMACVNMPAAPQACEQVLKITARPGSKLILVTFVVRVRSYRPKLLRKLRLAPGERSTELFEERLTVSFSLRREAQEH